MTDIDLFAALVNDQPDLFDLLDPSSNYAILAPKNSAGKLDTGGVRGRGGGVSPQLALAFVQQASGDPPLAARQRTLKTVLKDPKYVDLGPGEPGRIVSLPLVDGTNTSIVAGMGKGVTFGGQGNPFAAGAIYVGDE